MGEITKDGFGPLVRVHGRFTAESYCSIQNDVALPFLLGEAFPDGDFILQQDRSPIHTSKLASSFLQQRAVAVLEWPPQSSDMNIIERIWGKHEGSVVLPQPTRPVVGQPMVSIVRLLGGSQGER